MRFEFVRTPEFDENIRILVNTLLYLSKPKNLIFSLFNLSIVFMFYIMICTVAGIIGG